MKHILIILSFLLLIPPLFDSLKMLHGREMTVLDGVGFVSMGFDRSSCYHRQPDRFNPLAAFIFEGIGEDEVIVDFGIIGGGAAGLEID